MASTTATTTTIIFLSILLITTTAAFDTTTSTTTTTVPPSLSPSTTLSLPSPPPPPPQPLQDPPQQLQFNTIIDAIIGAGDFSNWASLLSQTDPSIFPLSATLLVPDDTSFNAAANTPPSTTTNSTTLNALNPVLFSYHIIPRRFTFTELCLFPTGARLPTLLPGNTLLITNNSAVNFTINSARVTRPDLFHSSVVAVHGVSGVLDYTHFGNDDVSSPPENPLPTTTPPPITTLSPAPSPANTTLAPISPFQSPLSPVNPTMTYQFLIDGNNKSPAKSVSRSLRHILLSYIVVVMVVVQVQLPWNW